MDDNLYRQRAAERALDYVENGMAIGLGTGSTASFMLRGLAARLAEGRLQRIVGVPTSEQTAALARELGIPLTTLDQHPSLDLALDGADEIDPQLRLIKGLGGAMLREKIVAASAERFIVMASASKRVKRLGERSPLPVEVVAFGMPLCMRRLAALGGEPVLRRDRTGAPFVTDEGHMILDCHFGIIADPEALAAAICAIPGVVAHGLFIGMASLAVIAGPDGIVEIHADEY
ncbi:MAG: ribose-5-phosphate isomerase RpiA [Roseiflexaceae bacterium]|nr:ribose-5-phosphate isomerase RpiA [Roseiflexaceae bacterium]